MTGTRCSRPLLHFTRLPRRPLHYLRFPGMQTLHVASCSRRAYHRERRATFLDSVAPLENRLDDSRLAIVMRGTVGADRLQQRLAPGTHAGALAVSESLGITDVEKRNDDP